MIARHRGDSRVHSRWRPPTPAAPPPPPTATEDDAVFSQQSDDLLSGQGDLDPPRGSHRKPRALIAFATVVAVAVIAGEQHTASGPAVPRLPSTPQQWVSRWTAAELQNPAEVCDHLYAPALSRAFEGDTGHGCVSDYTSVNSSSFRIRHVLEDGPTAAVEAKQLGAGRKRGYFTMLLSHVSGGWQAVDVVPGGSTFAR
jgi:hypothetical protein